MTDSRVAFVTGASSGIGAAIARVLGARGMPVAVNYRQGGARAEDVVQQIERKGGRAVAVRADITQGDQVRDAVRYAESSLGPISVLVLNATGVYGNEIRLAPVTGTAAGYAAWVLERQIGSIFHPVHHVVPGMAERGGGCIVAVSAALAQSPSPGFVALSMAKAAVDAAVRTLAAELGRSGIRVNAVSPGFTATPSTQHFPEPVRRAVAEHTALGRVARPEDVAEAVAFLASDQSCYLTGVCLPVDGGTAIS